MGPATGTSSSTFALSAAWTRSPARLNEEDFDGVVAPGTGRLAGRGGTPRRARGAGRPDGRPAGAGAAQPVVRRARRVGADRVALILGHRSREMTDDR